MSILKDQSIISPVNILVYISNNKGFIKYNNDDIITLNTINSIFLVLSNIQSNFKFFWLLQKYLVFRLFKSGSKQCPHSVWLFMS